MTRLRIGNLAQAEGAGSGHLGIGTARIDVFKKRKLFISREERKRVKITTFVDSVRELAEEVANRRAELVKEGVFVIVELCSIPPDEEDGLTCETLSEQERRDFVTLYQRTIS